MKSICTWMLALSLGSVAVQAASNPTENPENEGDRHFESLTVGELEFSDVWVHRQTNAVILIRHSMGIHSIKLSDLPADELEELKSQVGDLANLPEPKSGWQTNPLVQKFLALFGGGSPRTKIMFGIVAGLCLLLFVVRLVGNKSPQTA